MGGGVCSYLWVCGHGQLWGVQFMYGRWVVVHAVICGCVACVDLGHAVMNFWSVDSSYVWAHFSWQSLQQRTTIRMRSMRRIPPSPEATMINISNVVSTGTTEDQRNHRNMNSHDYGVM